ncbi:hypothetical protein D3C71_745630 [compost metagenome]
MGGIEQGRIGICNLCPPLKQLTWNRGSLFPQTHNFIEQLYGCPCPYRPVSKKTSCNSFLEASSLLLELVGCEQVGHNVIIVSGIQHNFIFSAGHADCPNHIQGLISVEGSHLDGFNAWNLRKLSPERITERLPAHSGLQIESKHRNNVRNRLDPLQQLSFGPVSQTACAYQPKIIIVLDCELCLPKCLIGGPAYPCYLDQRTVKPGGFHLFSRKTQNRFKQAYIRVTNFKLCAVYGNGNPACTGGHIITCQCPLPALIQLAVLTQCQGMRGYDRTLLQQASDRST